MVGAIIELRAIIIAIVVPLISRYMRIRLIGVILVHAVQMEASPSSSSQTATSTSVACKPGGRKAMVCDPGTCLRESWSRVLKG